MDDFDSPCSLRMPSPCCWVRAGFAIVLVSAAPLILVIAASSIGLWPDPNPN